MLAQAHKVPIIVMNVLFLAEFFHGGSKNSVRLIGDYL